MIIVTAATRWEANPIASRLGLLRRGPGEFHGIVDGRAVLLLETGMGPHRTEEALGRLGEFSGPLTVISSGLAGALQPGINSGDLVADVREIPSEYVELAKDVAAKLKLKIHFGAFHSVERALSKPAEKRAVGVEERAVAVDMESGAVRAWCEERRGTFIGLRAVLDTVDQRLPREIYEGEGSAGDLTRYVLRNVGEIPLFAMLGIRQKRAMSRLSHFLDNFLSEL